jgi:hypothetical protein
VHNRTYIALFVLLAEQFVGKGPHEALVRCGSLFIFFFLLFNLFAEDIETVNNQHFLLWLPFAIELDNRKLFLLGSRNIAIEEVFFIFMPRLVSIPTFVCGEFRILLNQHLVLHCTSDNSCFHIVGRIRPLSMQIVKPLPVFKGHVELLLLWFIFEYLLSYHNGIALKIVNSHLRIHNAWVNSEIL